MKRRVELLVIFFVIFALFSTAWAGIKESSDTFGKVKVEEMFRKIPLYFIKSDGQLDEELALYGEAVNEHKTEKGIITDNLFESNPVLYYSFDSCDAHDNSGNGIDGTIHGNPECVDGYAGKAFSFDGNDDFIEVNHVFTLRDFTVAVWFKTDVDGRNPLVHASEGTRPGLKVINIIMYNSNNLEAEYRPVDGPIDADKCEMHAFDLNLADGQWHFVALVRDATGSGKGYLYVDGKKVAECADPDPSEDLVTDIPIKIAHSYYMGRSEYFTGVIDEVKIYNYAPSDAERMLTISKSGTGSGTVVSYPALINCGGKCSASFQKDSSVTLTAIPDAGNSFSGWGGDCSDCGNGAICQLTMDSDKSCTAEFTGSKCSAEHLDLCKSQKECEDAGGTWCSAYCSEKDDCGWLVLRGKLYLNGETFNPPTITPVITVLIRCGNNDPKVAVTGAHDGAYIVTFDYLPSNDLCTADIYADGGSVRGHKQVKEFREGVMTVDIELHPSGKPVILVPGIMGSHAGYSYNILDYYPGLPQGYARPENLNLYNPTIKVSRYEYEAVGWNGLKEALHEAGFDISDFPYDWRAHLETITNELAEFISKKKKETGYEKVDIVAHSMGGLVVRNYIQSQNYNNDIDRFVMVGTPNHGSLLAYPVWYKGDPLLADKWQGSEDINNKPGEYLYSMTLNKLSKTEGQGELLINHEYKCLRQKCIPVPTAPKYKVTKQKIKNFVQQYVPSVEYLLPDDLTGRVPNENVQNNKFLEDLNNDLAVYSLMRRVKQMVIFLSNSEQTPSEYKNGNLTRGDGDGTVLVESGNLEAIGSCVPSKVDSKGKHVSLIKEFKDEIVNFLKEGRYDLQPIAMTSSYKPVGQSSQDMLSFSVPGTDADIVINTPDGKKDGYDPTSEQFNTESENSEVIRNNTGSSVTYKEPIDGKYSVSLYSGFPAVVTLEVSYYSGENLHNLSLNLYVDGLLQLDIYLDSTEDYPLGFSTGSNVLPPENVTASDNGSGKTLLTWSAPSQGGSPSNYIIYYKEQFSDNPWEVLATVSGNTTQYLTSHDYNSSSVRYMYAIASEDSTGGKSILSDIVSSGDTPFTGPQFSLTVRKQGTGDGRVFAIPGNIDCGSGCNMASDDYATGTTVRLVADSDNNSVFTGWSKDCAKCGRNRECSVKMDEDHECIAGFYDVTVRVFDDVDPNGDLYWAFKHVNAIFSVGITKGCGYGTYCPAMNVTRAQMAAFIVRSIIGEPTEGCTEKPFDDVPVDSWYCKYVRVIKDLGIAHGYGNGLYGPDDQVTREQMAKFLTNALISKGEIGPVPDDYCNGEAPFPDVDPQSWSCRYIKRIKELHITTGYPDGTYKPYYPVTRAQMAVFLTKAFTN